MINNTEQEGIIAIKKIYDDFNKKIKIIEAERDEKISEIINKINARQIKETRKNINN